MTLGTTDSHSPSEGELVDFVRCPDPGGNPSTLALGGASGVPERTADAAEGRRAGADPREETPMSVHRRPAAAPTREQLASVSPHPPVRTGESAGDAVADNVADTVADRLEALLRSRGADEIPHPGGTLLAHLRRVSALLERWGVRPAVRLAGLGHAFYGSDGFPTALGAVDRRDELAAVVGLEVEQMIYLYAGCDRAFSYPNLAEPEGPFRVRFTGAIVHLSLRWRRDFAELTVANELDVIRSDPELRACHGKSLFALFLQWRPLLSDPAWQAVRASLP